VSLESGSDRYIIRFHDESAGHEALANIDATVIKRFGKTRAETASSASRSAKRPFAAVRMSPQAAAALASNPAIEYVEVDPIRRPMAQTTPYGIDMVQAPLLWGGAEGAGVKICIIDSGFYTEHEDLQSSNISGYPADWANDTCGHGTHVGGTIAALHNDIGLVGVLPNGVELHIIKIFDGEDCHWAYASDLVDALERCESAGSNIVSMSLGGIGDSQTERNAFQDAYDRGVLNISAAGNGGNSLYSYPASYSSVVSVAAVDANKEHADFSQTNDQVELAAPGVAVESTLPVADENSFAVNGVTYQANHIEDSARTDGTEGILVDGGLCKSSGDWSGRIVLCERGEILFYDKLMNVESGGGVAAVIYNNLPGNFHGILGDDLTSSIPAISLTQEDGQYLLANELGVSGTMTSTYEAPASGYAAREGTSMAAPHVSGVAALVWSQNTAWTNAQIRDAFTATALDLGPTGWDNLYGYGLVQAQAAVEYLGGRPNAKFTVGCRSLHCSFSDTSSDVDGTIVTWSWSFGDGSNSREQNPSHAYAASGTYTVTLTVTDDQGTSHSASGEVIVDIRPALTETVTPPPPDGLLYHVALTWVRAISRNVDIYLNGGLYRTTINSGTVTYLFGSGTYTFQVCEAGTDVCSDEVVTSF
jgi:subtilisin family serine protease